MKTLCCQQLTRFFLRLLLGDAIIIIGIDPGPKRHAAIVLDDKRIVEFLDDHDTAQVLQLCRGYPNAVIACEWVASMGMAVGHEVFETVWQIGVLSAGLSAVRLIPRMDVKLYLCQTNRAKDKNIRQALLDLVGPVGTTKNRGPCYGVASHTWAALAVAVTARDNTQTEHEAVFHLPTLLNLQLRAAGV